MRAIRGGGRRRNRGGGRSRRRRLLGGKRGAVVGGCWARSPRIGRHYHDQREKNLADTRRGYTEYNPAKERASRSSVWDDPTSASPGDTVEILMTYAVLTRGRRDGPVRESRMILFEGSKVGEASVDIEREEVPGAPSSHHAPGNARPETTASSPRWSRAEEGRTSRRSRSASTVTGTAAALLYPFPLQLRAMKTTLRKQDSTSSSAPVTGTPSPSSVPRRGGRRSDSSPCG